MQNIEPSRVGTLTAHLPTPLVGLRAVTATHHHPDFALDVAIASRRSAHPHDDGAEVFPLIPVRSGLGARQDLRADCSLNVATRLPGSRQVDEDGKMPALWCGLDSTKHGMRDGSIVRKPRRIDDD
jgi:hypothetical protein